MRLLHTSDWHIGRQLHGVSLLDDQAHVLEQVIAIVAEQRVDVVLIAGDIYDRSVPPADAVRLLNATLNRLCRELEVPVIVIAGNHDSGDRLDFGADLLRDTGLHIVGTLTTNLNPVCLTVDGVTVDFFGLPYADPARVRHLYGADVSTHEQAMEQLLARVESQRVSGRPTVLLSHCFIDGGSESESERPLSIGGADRIAPELFLPYSYVALGHLHRPQFKGAEHVRYSGSLLKYSFSEAYQNKAVTLVDIDAAGAVSIAQVALQPRRNMRVLDGALADILRVGATDPAADDYVMARLSDTHAILDIMGRLREVYPNTLHLERPGLMPRGALAETAKAVLKKGELALFEDFFNEVNGAPVSDEQRAIVVETLEVLRSAAVQT